MKHRILIGLHSFNNINRMVNDVGNVDISVLTKAELAGTIKRWKFNERLYLRITCTAACRFQQSQVQEVCKNEYFINEKTDTPLREQLHGPDKYEVTGMLGLKIHFNMSSLEMD